MTLFFIISRVLLFIEKYIYIFYPLQFFFNSVFDFWCCIIFRFDNLSYKSIKLFAFFFIKTQYILFLCSIIFRFLSCNHKIYIIIYNQAFFLSFLNELTWKNTRKTWTSLCILKRLWISIISADSSEVIHHSFDFSRLSFDHSIKINVQFIIQICRFVSF